MTTATTTITQNISDQLAIWIEVDKKLINYREVAREFRININAAKRILAEHLNSNPSLQPHYLLTGDYLPSISTYTDTPTPSPLVKTEEDGMDIDIDVKNEEGGKGDVKNGNGKEMGKGYPLRQDEGVRKRGMILVGGKEEMEAKSTLFTPTSLSVTLYALSPSGGPIKDPSQYMIPLNRLRKYKGFGGKEEKGLLGVVGGGFDMLSGMGNGSGSGSGKNDNKSESSTKTSIPSAYVKSANKATASGSGAGAGSSSSKLPFGKSALGTVKQEEGKSKDREEKVEQKKPNKKRIVSDDEEEEQEKDEKPSKSTPALASSKAKKPLGKMNTADADQLAMEAMMAMDDGGNPSSPGDMSMQVDEDVGEGENSLASSSKAKSTTDQVNKKKRSSNVAGNVDTSADEATASAGASGSGSGRVRKKRRVVKKVMATDAKGYTVFNDESAEESYSSDGNEDVKPDKKKLSKGKKSSVAASGSGSASRAASEEKDVKPNVGSKAGDGAKAPSGSGAKAPPKKGQSSLNNFFKKK